MGTEIRLRGIRLLQEGNVLRGRGGWTSVQLADRPLGALGGTCALCCSPCCAAVVVMVCGGVEGGGVPSTHNPEPSQELGIGSWVDGLGLS